jgi:O-antigen ligase
VGAMVLSPLLIFAFVRFTPGVKEQLDVSILYINEYLEDPKEFVKNKQTYVGGNETRLIVWTGAYESIKDQPLGYGTGALKPILSKKLIELGQPNMADKNYDPHNQYFSTTIELGLLGLLILLSALLIPLFVGLKRRSGLLILLAVNLLFNSAFESMLQRQSGIVFYMFWFCLLFMITYDNTLKTKETESISPSE